MKIEVKKVIKSLDLGLYAEEYAGQSVDVWVNPTRNIMQRMDSLNEKSREWIFKIRDNVPKANEDRTKYQKLIDESAKWHEDEYTNGLYEWLPVIWSQGGDKQKHWTADECRELDKTEPALFGWLNSQTVKLMKEHRDREKKF